VSPEDAVIPITPTRREAIDFLENYVEPRHLADLNLRELYVLERRFHLAGRVLRHRASIAADLGISAERVRAIEVRALRRLRGMVYRQRRRASLKS
jgi:DNA-directed RNA polymerase sigma subunit (sigma70/sigma32)